MTSMGMQVYTSVTRSLQLVALLRTDVREVVVPNLAVILELDSCPRCALDLADSWSQFPGTRRRSATLKP